MELFRQTLGIILTFTALAGLLWWTRRRGLSAFSSFARMRQRPQQLEAVERLTLTPHHSLHLVRYAGRELLIASNTNGCVLLESHPDRKIGAQA
jgi:hypothetical protein